MSSARTVPMSYCQDWWDHVSERCTSVQRYSRELMLSKSENISVLSNGQNLFSVYCVPAGFSGLSLRTTSFLNWKKWWMTSEPQHPSKEVLRTPTWSPYHLKTWRRESSRLWEDTTGRWGRHRRCRFYSFSHINVTWCVDLTVRTRLRRTIHLLHGLLTVHWIICMQAQLDIKLQTLCFVAVNLVSRKLYVRTVSWAAWSPDNKEVAVPCFYTDSGSKT